MECEYSMHTEGIINTHIEEVLNTSNQDDVVIRT